MPLRRMKIRLSEKIHLGGSFFVFNLVFSLLAIIVMIYLLILVINNDSEGIQCVYKSKFGKDCPTCGFTRSFIDYLSFEFDSGIQRNAASFYYFMFCCYFSITRFSWVFYCLFFQKKGIQKRIIKWDITILIAQFLAVNILIFYFS